MKKLHLHNIGQIASAELTFGDLTVLVGPQASGKSIKLLADTGLIQSQLSAYGLDYGGELPAFLDTYFGEGMHSIWREGSAVKVDGKPVDVARRIARQQPGKKESVFMIPAQRVLMDREFTATGPLFPQNNRLKSDYRTLLQQSVFADFKLSVDKVQSQKRLVLTSSGW
jgi:energy-coupling factor transporter ATP-binding protein EcfA2